MNRATLETGILPRLLGGTSKMPLQFEPRLSLQDPKAPLKALSLAGQALRFDRPAPPPQFAVPLSVPDDRTIVPDGLRRPILRLFAGKPVTEHPALALANAFDEMRFRPHPFDLPKLDGFVRSYAEKLGATAQHWAQRQNESAEPLGYFDVELLDDANWTQATPARRAGYLQQRRSIDADAARTLLELNWPNERAELRSRLLPPLLTGLSIADQPFLETLVKDRAPTVRGIAQRMLARLGVADGNPALAVCLERIKRTETGLLRKRPQLALELPATIREPMAARWIRETFSEIGFGELAKALSLSEAELIAASAKDQNLLLALALMATTDRRLNLLESIVAEHLPTAWELLFASGVDELALLHAAERLRWAEILAHPYSTKLPEDYMAWNWLHRMLDGPAPTSLVQTILKSDWLDNLPGVEKQGRYWMELIAALAPSGQRVALITRLGAFDSSITSTAIPLLEILEALEKVRPHA